MELTPEEFNRAPASWTSSSAIEIARYVFGRPAEFRRRAARTQQVQTALGLLRQAQSPKELLGLAVAGSRPEPARN